MATPYKTKLNYAMESVKPVITSAIDEAGYQVKGSHYELGKYSFKDISQSERTYYLHLKPMNEGSTQIVIAPGLSQLAEVDDRKISNKVPRRIVEQIQNLLQTRNK